MSKDDSGNLLLAFLLGAVSGAAVALLFAPASGRQTREYLGDKAREGRETLSDAIERGREAYQQARGVGQA